MAESPVSLMDTQPRIMTDLMVVLRNHTGETWHATLPTLARARNKSIGLRMWPWGIEVNLTPIEERTHRCGRGRKSQNRAVRRKTTTGAYGQSSYQSSSIWNLSLGSFAPSSEWTQTNPWLVMIANLIGIIKRVSLRHFSSEYRRFVVPVCWINSAQVRNVYAAIL